jgi:hypothetical protein
MWRRVALVRTDQPSPRTTVSQRSFSSFYSCPNHPSPHTTVSQRSFSSHYCVPTTLLLALLCPNDPSPHSTHVPAILLTLLCPNHPSPHFTHVPTILLLTPLMSQRSFSSRYYVPTILRLTLLCPNHPSPHFIHVLTILLLTPLMSQPSFSSFYSCPNDPSPHTTHAPTILLLRSLQLTCAPTMPLRSLGRSVCDQLLLAQGWTFSRSAVKLKLRIWLCMNLRTFQGRSLCLQQNRSSHVHVTDSSTLHNIVTLT